MAVPFCKVRPELREVLVGTKSAFAALRRVIEARSAFGNGGAVPQEREKAVMRQPLRSGEAVIPAWGVRVGGGKPDHILRGNRNRADDLRTLFATHYEATGIVLCVDGIRQTIRDFGYSGPPEKADTYSWYLSNLRVRLSENLQTGVREETYEHALRQFSAIWPEGLAWPISTPPSQSPDTGA